MLRADKNFSLLSKSIVVNSLAMLVFVSTLTYFFKLEGIYFAVFFATIASAAYVKFNTRYKLKFYFNLKLFHSLSKVGLPIFIGGLVYMLLFSVDKIMIAKMMGPKYLGFYSIAILALTYAYSLPKIFGLVAFPTMQEEFAKSDSRERVLAFVKKPTFVMAYLFPAVLALAYFGIPIIVHYILPKYALGIGSMKILLCGCFFISLVPLMQNFLITINKQIALIPLTAAAVLFSVAINYGAIKMGYGIMGVALGTSAAYFLYFTLIFFYVLLHCEKWPDAIKSFLSVCVPFIYSFTVIIITEHFIKTGSIIIDAIIHLSIFYIVYLPMLWYINKKADIISKLFKKNRIELPIGGIDETCHTDTVL
jgi:O-antigen/teichoic acid export membrane protein